MTVPWTILKNNSLSFYSKASLPETFYNHISSKRNLATLHEHDEYAQRNKIKHKTIQIIFLAKNLSERHNNHIFAIFCVSFRMLKRFLRGILLFFLIFPLLFPPFFQKNQKLKFWTKNPSGKEIFWTKNFRTKQKSESL